LATTRLDVRDANRDAGGLMLQRRRFMRQAIGSVAIPLVARAARAQVPAQPQLAAPPSRAVAEQMAAYVDGLRYEDIDGKTIERVKSHLIDTLGCGIAAFDENPVRICRDIALSAGGGRSTVIGTSSRAAADLATFANGAAFRYFDLNDVYVGRATCHPSDGIAACLAVAEAEGASTSELITAIVIAYEVNCRLADAFDFANRGWDEATVSSPPAVALAVGKLMKLPPKQLTQAVNLAINDHIPMGQTRAQALSDWKGLADADAARNGVFAAMLARGGLTGPAPIFEGRRGFFQLVSGPAEVNVGAFGGRGVPFKINECGMKAFPVVVYAQTVVVASLAMAKEVGDLDRVAAIEIVTTRQGYQSAGRDPEKWTPENRDTADHSMPYIAARVMFDGDIDNRSYTEEKLRDPRIRAFMRKITVVEDAKLGTPPGAAPPTRMTAVLVDGQRITKEVVTMAGFAGQPMSRADVERKFRSNIGARWSGARTESVLQQLWTLERMGDARSLLAIL
jgi:2-methylcitrate dehydratase